MRHLFLTEYSYNNSYYFVIKTTFFKANSKKNSISFALYSYHDRAILLSEKKMTNDIVELQTEFVQRLFETQNYQVMHYDKKHIRKQFKEKKNDVEKNEFKNEKINRKVRCKNAKIIQDKKNDEFSNV